MYTLKKFFLHSPGHYIAAVVLAALVCMFRFNNLDDLVSPQFAWYDSLSVAGYATFLVGALFTVAFFGAFDLFTYVFSPGRIGANRKFKSYAQYANHKEELRARQTYYFVPYYVVGVVVYLISLLFA